MSIAIYTLTSELHDEQAVDVVTKEFLGALGIDYEMKGSDYTDYGSHPLSLIYVRTGGTEGIFKSLLPKLQQLSDAPFYLLTSGKSNSLATSMEILSFLRQIGIRGEIIHGSNAYIRQRIEVLQKVGEARTQQKGCRLGVIGKPSDWLISSEADREEIHKKLGIELLDVPMDELIATIESTPLKDTTLTSEVAKINDALPGAERIYASLKEIINKYNLQGFTLRCFDLLTAVKNTGCLALAKLNAEGIVSGCEGDVPAMLSMMVAKSLTGVSGFQANPASIDVETGKMLFAHCTIPLNMVERYEFDTHFESGIGVGIRGYMKEGEVTVFKLSGDLKRSFIAEGVLLYSQAKPDLCRTQQVIQLNDKAQALYFLNEPIGNHHIILPGRWGSVLKEMLG
jgi:L-fucose isomerase-like protein